jgi:DNA processing protein
MLFVVGGVKRLLALTANPVAAIVGSRRASDYGIEMARSIARGLVASGVTITSGFADGIASAAHAGALELDGWTIAAMAGGVETCTPAGRRALYERVTSRGCALAELPCGARQRRWCEIARARTVAGLAQLTIVVEADEHPRELAEARAARALGRTVAAVPGRVTSALSRGTCALLMDGAPLVRDARDALELLYGHGSSPPRAPAAPNSAAVEPRLRTVLEQVGAGNDTLSKLAVAHPEETMLALCELELMGLLARGDGGRYVLRNSLTG